MSLGPKDVEIKEMPLSRVRVMTAEGVKKFLTRPSYVLFYCGMAAALGALYVGKILPLSYYAILGILGSIELVLWYMQSPPIAPKK